MFTQIRKAVRHGIRHSYLSLDMTWIDRLVQTGTKLKVTVLNASSDLRDKIMEPPSNLPNFAHNEVFQLLYISPSSPVRKASSAKKILPDDVDNFLTFNPCWIPLHEPIYEYSWDKRNSSESADTIRDDHLILARLPVFSFHATCRLFSQWTKHQHPQHCNYSPDRSLAFLMFSLTSSLLPSNRSPLTSHPSTHSQHGRTLSG
jgi:hypothetical protein